MYVKLIVFILKVCMLIALCNESSLDLLHLRKGRALGVGVKILFTPMLACQDSFCKCAAEVQA